jgi:hypothetical protein
MWPFFISDACLAKTVHPKQFRIARRPASTIPYRLVLATIMFSLL